MLWWISVLVPLASGIGVVGLAILFVAAPAVFTVVVQLLERILGRMITTRPGCVVLALAVAIPCTYGIAADDAAHQAAVAAAQAQAAFAHRLAAAAQLAAAGDQQRAAAAEARANQAEEEAHALAAQVPNMACFAPADTDRLRQLWPAAPRKARAAAHPRSIPDLLRRGNGPAAGGGADGPPAVRPGGGAEKGR